MAMDGVNNTQGYTKVTFNDAQNNNMKTYQVPSGTTIFTSNDKYEVKSNGVFHTEKTEYDDHGRAIVTKLNEKVNYVPVILPQMVALEHADGNKDGKLDVNDAKFYEKAKDAFGETLSNKVVNRGSKYYVREYPSEWEDVDSSWDANIDKDGFSAIFSPNGRYEIPSKSISVFWNKPKN